MQNIRFEKTVFDCLREIVLPVEGSLLSRWNILINVILIKIKIEICENLHQHFTHEKIRNSGLAYFIL